MRDTWRGKVLAAERLDGGTLILFCALEHLL